MSQRSNSRNEIIPNDPRYYRMQGQSQPLTRTFKGMPRARVHGSCMGAFAVNGSRRQPRDFFRQFSAESAPQIKYYAESAAVMRGVCKMCTIQTSRRPPIARQTQISKTAPMNPAIR